MSLAASPASRGGAVRLTEHLKEIWRRILESNGWCSPSLAMAWARVAGSSGPRMVCRTRAAAGHQCQTCSAVASPIPQSGQRP
eukprot:2374855-Pyramimonas_sp.AAC.1